MHVADKPLSLREDTVSSSPNRAAGSGRAHRDATGPAPAAKTSGRSGKPKATPTAELLAGIGLALDLWHDPTQAAFATIGRLSHPIRSKAFRQFLVNEYRKRTGGKVPNAEALSAALGVIE